MQLEEERTRLEARLQEFAASVEVEKLNAQTKRGTVEQRQKRLRELQVELQAASAEQDQFLQAAGGETFAPERARTAGRFARRFQRGHAGRPAPDRAPSSARWPTASACRTQYVVAIENALGHHLQLVLTEQPESAQQILADLTASKSGRASVAALSMEYNTTSSLPLRRNGAGQRPGRDSKRPATGPVIRALSVVQAEPSVEKLLQALLGRTFIASDLATATAQFQNGHAGCDFVTLTGDLLNRHGIYTGGYLNGNGNPQGAGLHSRPQKPDLRIAR